MNVGASIYDHIRRPDVEAFRDAARRFAVHILVRRTNPASLPYVGRDGYVPKPIDCKPKTADRDVVLPSGLIVRCAGLVVDPMLPGFDKAFRPEKVGKAQEEWRRFALKHGLWDEARYTGTLRPRPGNLSSGKAYLGGSSLGSEDGRIGFTIDRGGVYLVQAEPTHLHYGCLMFCPLNLRAFPQDARAAIELLATRPGNGYIHGDYDLFGIVPAAMPAFKTVRQAILYGVENTFGPRAREIADFLNARFHAPMVQHGAQEDTTMETGADEHLDVFWADGTLGEARGRAAIEKLYAVDFAGRRTGPQSSGLVH